MDFVFMDELKPLVVRQRVIEVPRSISKAAQIILSASADLPSRPEYPAIDDISGWEELVKTIDNFVSNMRLGEEYEGKFDCDTIALSKGKVYTAAFKDDRGTREEKVLFDIHGGALIAGGGDLARRMMLRMAGPIRASVAYSPDYRMPPHHSYPAALDDCFEAYCAVLKRHSAERVVVLGSSAGGNLAAALMLRVREAGVSFPAGLVLNSPELDLTESGDSFSTLLGVDTGNRGSYMPVNQLYANGNDLRDPFISPLFGDFSKGWPRTLILIGTRDLFLSNAVRMHNFLRKSGNDAQLLVYEAMPHGGFFGTSEDEEMMDDIRSFAESSWAI